MKSLAALLHRGFVDSSVDTNRSSSRSPAAGAGVGTGTGTGTGPGADAVAAGQPPAGASKKRLGALSGLVDRLSSLRRDRGAAKPDANPTGLRQLEQRLRHHPELKPARLAQYRAELGLEGDEGVGALTVHSLARMPPKLVSRIAAIRHAGVVNTRTIDAVWDALETNMELFEGPLHAVATAAARPLASIAHHAALDDGRRLITTPAAAAIADFHRMLVQDKVALVVDLTRAARSERHVPYAPAKAGNVLRATSGTIDVTCKARGKLPPLGALQQQLQVHDVTAPVTKATLATSSVTRLHFKGWPAHGPIDAKTLVTLADLVESLSPDRARPTLIHAPDGSGRSDTLMTFMAARKRIADETGASVGGGGGSGGVGGGDIDVDVDVRSGAGNACSVALIMSTLADVVAGGRLARGPSFLANRDDFAVIASTLVQQFEPAIRQSSRATQTAAPIAPSAPRSPVAASRTHASAAPGQSTPTASSSAVQAPPAVTGPLGGSRALASATPTEPAQPPAGIAAVIHAREPATQRLEPAAEQAWRRLAERTQGLPPGPMVPAELVGSNVAGIDCPRNTALQVRQISEGQSAQAFLHANAITFSGVAGADGGRADGVAAAPGAAVGQSPLSFDLCERFLLKGLDSGEGLYQFVSTSAHRNRIKTVENPILAQLKRQFDAVAGKPDGLVLGGRYRVTGVTQISGEESDFRRIRIDVTELGNPGGARSMLLTQAGLKFQDNVLRADEIARASELMDSHQSLIPGSSSMRQGEPLVVSFTGVGRSATLVTYREALQRLPVIERVADIDAMLEQIVMDGRKDRGPGFVHSSAQLAELRSAVLAVFTGGPGVA